MKSSFLLTLTEWWMGFFKKPWACFETTGPEAGGRLPFSIHYNRAFVEKLQKLGMAGQTDEETLQMFFLQLRMIPEEALNVNPQATPTLTDEANKFIHG